MNGYPGSNLAQMRDVSEFSEHRVNLAFDQSVATHQTNVIQAPTSGDDDQAMRGMAAVREIMNSVSNPILIALRSQHPFVSIVPFPMRSILVVASKNNDVRDIQLPDGCQMVQFSARDTVDFFVGVNGQCVMPALEDLTGGAAIYNPTGQWYYCMGLRSLSVGIATIGAAVAVQCYIQL